MGLKLRVPTSPKWIEVALSDFDAFLQDHASCERKASATALVLVSKYRDRPELVAEMIDLAREELEHFQQVYRVLAARGVPLGRECRDEYVNQLAALVRTGREDHFLDRLLVAGIIEGRGTERFAIVAERHPEAEMRSFYMELCRAEARHHAVFTRLARRYFSEHVVNQRLSELLEAEAAILGRLPLRPAVH